MVEDPEDAKFSVSALLCARRQLAGIDYHDMGSKIGLSGLQVRALESGDSRPFRGKDAFAKALRIYARKLGVDPIAANESTSRPECRENKILHGGVSSLTC